MIAVGVLDLTGLGLAWPASQVEDWTAFLGFLIFASAAVFLGVQLEAALPKISLFERSGDASYSTYLTHIYVAGAMSWLAYAVLPSRNTAVDVTVAISTIAFATAVGLLVHRSIEVLAGRRLALLSARSRGPTLAAKA